MKWNKKHYQFKSGFEASDEMNKCIKRIHYGSIFKLT